MRGNATFTMVASSDIIPLPRMVASKIHRPWDEAYRTPPSATEVATSVPAACARAASRVRWGRRDGQTLREEFEGPAVGILGRLSAKDLGVRRGREAMSRVRVLLEVRADPGRAGLLLEGRHRRRGNALVVRPEVSE